ncbi:golgin subfamily B member 1 isoform X5 [Alosa sapidissima]|uniref:golgin subfamily B member 1 isoform X5 n=1 Tax=Alosa sapidissima TaxID=34773 RepID=UPI001C0A40FC|nr:golgin subfamily B member 1 isoform X5 [Alosa sapidissima]
MGTQVTGRKRIPNREKMTAEDDALSQIAREAEARLAAKRAARAEAREIRMRELERQQKEEESERYSRHSRRNTSISDDEERMSVGSRGSLRPSTLCSEATRSRSQRGSVYEESLFTSGRRFSGSSCRVPSEYSGFLGSSSRASSRASSARASPVVEERMDRDFFDKGSRTASTLSAATLASLGGGSSRRGSCDTSISADTEASIREMKDSLTEVEEKYRRAMVSNAQLDNEKSNLMYQVDTLRDTLMELEEQMCEMRREYEEKAKDYERERHAHAVLKVQFTEMKESLKQSEELLVEAQQLRLKQHNYVREISDLQETLEWKEKKIGALERQKEYSDSMRDERNAFRDQVLRLQDALKKHGITLTSEPTTNGDAGESVIDGHVTSESASQLAQDSDSILGRGPYSMDHSRQVCIYLDIIPEITQEEDGCLDDHQTPQIEAGVSEEARVAESSSSQFNQTALLPEKTPEEAGEEEEDTQKMATPPCQETKSHQVQDPAEVESASVILKDGEDMRVEYGSEDVDDNEGISTHTDSQYLKPDTDTSEPERTNEERGESFACVSDATVTENDRQSTHTPVESSTSDSQLNSTDELIEPPKEEKSEYIDPGIEVGSDPVSESGLSAVSKYIQDQTGESSDLKNCEIVTEVSTNYSSEAHSPEHEVVCEEDTLLSDSQATDTLKVEPAEGFMESINEVGSPPEDSRVTISEDENSPYPSEGRINPQLDDITEGPVSETSAVEVHTDAVAQADADADSGMNNEEDALEALDEAKLQQHCIIHEKVPEEDQSQSHLISENTALDVVNNSSSADVETLGESKIVSLSENSTEWQAEGDVSARLTETENTLKTVTDQLETSGANEDTLKTVTDQSETSDACEDTLKTVTDQSETSDACEDTLKSVRDQSETSDACEDTLKTVTDQSETSDACEDTLKTVTDQSETSDACEDTLKSVRDQSETSGANVELVECDEETLTSKAVDIISLQIPSGLDASSEEHTMTGITKATGPCGTSGEVTMDIALKQEKLHDITHMNVLIEQVESSQEDNRKTEHVIVSKTETPVRAEVISEISFDAQLTDIDAATGTISEDTINDMPEAEMASVVIPGEGSCKHSHHEENSESAETELRADAPLGGIEDGAELAHLGEPAGSPHADKSLTEDAPAENEIIAAAAEPSSAANSMSRPQNESGAATGEVSAFPEVTSKFADTEERSTSDSGDDRADSQSAPVSLSSEDKAEEFNKVAEKPVPSPGQRPGPSSCEKESTDASTQTHIQVAAGREDSVDETTSEETTSVQGSGSVLCAGESTDATSSPHIEVTIRRGGGAEETAEEEMTTASIQTESTEEEIPIVRGAEALEDSQDDLKFLQSCVLATQLDFEFDQAQDLTGSAVAIPVEPVEEIIKDGFTGKAFKKKKFKIKRKGVKRKGDCRLS